MGGGLFLRISRLASVAALGQREVKDLPFPVHGPVGLGPPAVSLEARAG